MSGYVFMLSEGAVSWGSKKQECVALSTAELRQNVYTLLCLMLYKSLFGSRQLIIELGSPFEMPIMIFEDNQSVINRHDKNPTISWTCQAC